MLKRYQDNFVDVISATELYTKKSFKWQLLCYISPQCFKMAWGVSNAAPVNELKTEPTSVIITS